MLPELNLIIIKRNKVHEEMVHGVRRVTGLVVLGLLKVFREVKATSDEQILCTTGEGTDFELVYS